MRMHNVLFFIKLTQTITTKTVLQIEPMDTTIPFKNESKRRLQFQQVILPFAAGIVCSITSPFSISFFNDNLNITLVWSLVFPIFFAMAYGTRAGFWGGLGGTIHYFILFPKNGVSNYANALVFLFVITVIGYISEKRKTNAISITRAFLYAFLVISVYFLYYLFAFDYLLSFNARFPGLEAVSTIERTTALKIILKSLLNFGFIILFCESLLRINEIRRLTGLVFNPSMAYNKLILVTSLLSSILIWYLFYLLDHFFVGNDQLINKDYLMLSLWTLIGSSGIIARILIYFQESSISAKILLQEHERKLLFSTHEALEKEKKIKRFLDAVRDVYYEVNFEGIILEISTSIEFISQGQYTRKGLIGSSLDEIYANPGDRSLFLNEIRKNGSISDYELWFKGVNKVPTPCSVSAAISFDEEGNPDRIVGYLKDISERKNFENAILQAKIKAEESDQLKSAFLANMSHEIRTPMNGIIGFTELLREPNLTKEMQTKYIEIIQKSGERMLNTVNDIIEISKIETGQVSVVADNTSLQETLIYIQEFFTPEAKEKGLSLEFQNSVPAEQDMIHTDRAKLDSILINLVKNAIKYTDEGSVRINTSITDGTVIIEVKDTGIGIPIKRQKAVFDRFVQADIMDHNVFEGSGLGLSICKAYVELLGGEIILSSEENTGSVFRVILPLRFNPPHGEDISEVNKLSKGNFKKGILKVLIAEDDDNSYTYLSILMKKYAKRIDRCKTGKEVIQYYKANPDTDLILMDIRMPQLGGYEATARIRKMDHTIPIIAQSAYALQGEEEKAVSYGCTAFIAKPIQRGKLYNLLQDLKLI